MMKTTSRYALLAATALGCGDEASMDPTPAVDAALATWCGSSTTSPRSHYCAVPELERRDG